MLYNAKSRNVRALTSGSRLVASVVLQATYGLTASSADDPAVRSINKALDEFSQVTAPGAYFVDSFPVCEQSSSSDHSLPALTSVKSEARPRMVSWSIVQEKGAGNAREDHRDREDFVPSGARVGG